MDKEEILKIYKAHRDRGASHEEALKAVQIAAQGSQPDSPDLAAQKRLSGSGGSATGDFGRMLAQGATFGFGDELAGLAGGDTEKSRQRVSDLRQLNPGALGAASLSEIAGAAALPVFAGGQAMRAGGGMLAGMGVGALEGGIQGGLTGAGEADEGDRLAEAKRGAKWGAAGGAVLAAAPSVANAAGRRIFKGKLPQRLTDLLYKSGAEDLYTLGTRASNEKRAAGAELEVLMNAHPSITDQGVLDALSSPGARDAVEAVRPGERFTPTKPPSLREVQTVRQALKDAEQAAKKEPNALGAHTARTARNEITSAVDPVVPGYKPTNQSYAEAVSLEKGAASKGLSRKSADEVKVMLTGKFPQMQEGMRARLANDIASSIGMGGKKNVWIEGMLHQKPEVVARLRNLFPFDDAGSAAFKDMVSELAMEQSAAKTRKALPFVAGGIGLGLGASKIAHLIP